MLSGLWFKISNYRLFWDCFYHRKVRDSDGPDQAIDLDRPTYEEIDEKISKMLFVDDYILKPIDQLKLEIKKLQALNIKSSLKSFIGHLWNFDVVQSIGQKISPTFTFRGRFTCMWRWSLSDLQAKTSSPRSRFRQPKSKLKTGLKNWTREARSWYLHNKGRLRQNPTTGKGFKI